MSTSTATEPLQQGTESQRPLSVGQKVSYGLGDMANAFSWNFISSFLLIFYTDVFGISAFVVSLLFLVGRLWDAFNDPLIGYLSDKTSSKWGRYRPRIAYGALPLAICTVLVFWAHPEFSEAGKIAYAFVTYLVVVAAYSCINIPYTALVSAMTQDPSERGSLASFRLALAIAGALITAQFGARLVPVLAAQFGGDMVMGYLLTAVILVALALPLYGVCFRNTREVIVPSEPLPKGYMRIALRSVLKNLPLILTILAHFLVGLTIYGRMAVVTYYFTYNIGDPGMAGTFFLFMQGPMMIGSFCSQYFADMVKSKGRVITISFVIYGVLSLINLTVTPVENTLLFWGLVAVANFSQGIGYALTYAVIPDTVEYNEYVSGVRIDAVAASLTTFWNKVGMAIGTSATAAILGVLNYVPGGVQSAETLSAINAIMFAVPGIAAIVVGVVFIGYKLDYATFENIVAKLKLRNANQNNQELI